MGLKLLSNEQENEKCRPTKAIWLVFVYIVRPNKGLQRHSPEVTSQKHYTSSKWVWSASNSTVFAVVIQISYFGPLFEKRSKIEYLLNVCLLKTLEFI